MDLLDELLGERALREHRFEWLRGDPGPSGQRAKLPVDAFYPRHRLVVEYWEYQHDQPSAFFDKRDRLTVSGVHRGEQRARYDRRRQEEIPRHGLRLLIVRARELSCDKRGRLLRDAKHDRVELARLLRAGTGQASAALLMKTPVPRLNYANPIRRRDCTGQAGQSDLSRRPSSELPTGGGLLQLMFVGFLTLIAIIAGAVWLMTSSH